MAELRLEDVYVRHEGADVDALVGVDLAVPDGVRSVLIGGSGSGKTTVLRAVAGVVPVVRGRVVLGGRDVTHLPARDRDLAMVHQQGALQPHLDVRRNLGFSLRLRGVRREEIRQRVNAEARAFELTDLLGRRPATLAAGERHEVALARSLVRRCAALLLDEPFARVDAHRRAELRRELLRVQQGYGVTMLLATNDPVTAHAVGEHVIALDRGRVAQAGTPSEVAAHPASTAIADLLVLPAMNLLPALLESRPGGQLLTVGPLRIAVRRPIDGRRVTVGIRPGDVQLTTDGIEVPVRHRAVLGDRVELTVGRAGDPPLRVITDRRAPAEGARVGLHVRPEHVHVFEATTGRALAHGV